VGLRGGRGDIVGEAVPLRGREPDEAGTGELAELAALADGSLAPDRRAALEARVAAEPALAALLAEQERAVSLARGAADEVAAPSALRARVEAQRPSPRRHRARRGLLVVAVAVPVILAIALGLQLTRSDTSGETLHAALAPTALDPGVTGDATLTKTVSGWRIELHAAGLPRREGTLFYQAWLRNGAGVLVPIGTFNEGTNVTLWAGVSPKDYPVLTVTREQADGNQASSGQKVLVGTAG
jgi:anti-sigma-K factor RskA